jgi:hypothetical protein
VRFARKPVGPLVAAGLDIAVVSAVCAVACAAPPISIGIDDVPALVDGGDEALPRDVGEPDADAGAANMDAPVLPDSNAAPPDTEAGVPETGPLEAGPDACPNDLSGIGMGTFHISFTVTVSQTGYVALLNQRSICAHSTFWDVRLYGGLLNVETDGPPAPTTSGYFQLQSMGVPINDGKPHKVRIKRTADHLISVFVDGDPQAVNGPSWASFSAGTLPQLQRGADICVGNPGDTTAALTAGTITDVCIGAP